MPFMAWHNKPARFEVAELNRLIDKESARGRMRDRRERRQKERCELSLATQVWPTNAPGHAYKALTVNLNAAGVQFALTSGNPEDFRPGASLRFYIELA